MSIVAAEDERRHPRGPDPLWAESWYFDFTAPDGTLGGYVRLGLYPNLGVAWYWAALVGQGRRLVLVRDHEVELPRGRDLEVRGEGIWSAVNCETPLDHWSVGLEAFAVALDDPAEAYRGERGDRIGLGYDLEWEATTPAAWQGEGWYWQPCRVTGEILVADEALAFDGAGIRAHRWGVQDWWSAPWTWASGVMADGPAFSAPLDLLAAQAIVAQPLASAPLLVTAPDGRSSRLARTLCRYQSPGGRYGHGWTDSLTQVC
ncbi:MAG: hypothetical protein QOE57_2467 [Acidimicrobiaceae bacterium]|jgi:hypothetical protein|nr:hypothetical protein [Acidimicrobiaceae bacterium]